MKTAWDYTELAEAYVHRPSYAPSALDEITEVAGLVPGDRVCDVGAGVAHLTLEWLDRGLMVDAVEPNDEMRRIGIERTANRAGVRWSEGVGEDTGRPDATYRLVSFGSSFNVCDRTLALAEARRIGVEGAWFTAMWNHRDLEDPIQAEIEAIIGRHVPDYGYGVRREDQSEFLRDSGALADITAVEGTILHTMPTEVATEAWRSHATLQRQAGDRFEQVVDEIGAHLASLGTEIIVPYRTRAWIGRLV